MILWAQNIFKRLDSSYNFNNIESNIRDAINISLLILQSIEQSYNDEYTNVKKVADNSAIAITKTKMKLTALTDSLNVIHNSSSSCNCTRKKTSKSLDNSELRRIEDLISEVSTVKVDLDYLSKATKDTKDASNKKELEFKE